MQIVFATKNEWKTRDARAAFEGLPAAVVDLNFLRRIQVNEDCATLVENAFAKADAVYRYPKRTDRIVVGEDFGVFATGLNGLPGKSPHLWTGKGVSLGKTERALLSRLKPEASREVVLRSVAVMITPDGKRHDFTAELPGEIVTQPGTKLRTPYPFERVFKPRGYDKVMAALPPEVRWTISPRTSSLAQARAVLEMHELMHCE